jgi:hypothetical protein
MVPALPTSTDVQHTINQTDSSAGEAAAQDNFGLEVSFLSDSTDAEFAGRKLKKVPHFRLKAERHHQNIRQTEQTTFETLLRQKRNVWLFADWGLGKESFLACIIERLNSHDVSDVYHFNCDEVDSYERFESEFSRQLVSPFKSLVL